jgi:5-methylcytosine-specific restriction endonuclease McrA
MIRLNYVIENEINEFDSIVQSKHLISRDNLTTIRTQVNNNFNEYIDRFGNIHNIGANSFGNEDSDELRNCYKIQTAALNDLKARLINCQTDTFKFICPYCLITKHTTFDHYIPIEEQPVFSVCAKNLIPSCNLCNNKKLEYWKETGQRAIIHFYNDIIPTEQFLYCDLTFNGSIPILSFRLSFPTVIDERLRFRIIKHFERLNLLDRYDDEVTRVLSDVNTDVIALEGFSPTIREVEGFLTRKAIDLFGRYGNNYWYAIAYLKLAASNQYIQTLLV